MDAIDLKLKALHTDITKFVDQTNSNKTAIRNMQTQLDAVDLKSQNPLFQGREFVKSAGQEIVESSAFTEARADAFRGKTIRINMSGSAFPRSVKASITDTALGTQTTGTIALVRLPGVTGLPQQELRIRDLLKVVKLTYGNAYDWIQQSTRTNAASPQVEAAAKSESTYLWNSLSDTVKTIAHYTNVSRQALDDTDWVRTMIDSELMYGLALKEENEILQGDGTGQHLKGLITQATAYNTGLNVTADTKLDKLRHAKLQARLAGLGTFAPDGMVLNPTDMAAIELIKDETGGANKGLYVVGDPKGGTPVKYVWGLPVVESDSIAAGTFLVGAFKTGAMLVDRMEATLEISYEHASNFITNMATVLCEERIGLACTRPGAFIYGTGF
ncbi:MAG TPA: phage major capsid protein [Solibacterales bacterium]|nr:phage major capsid protein [Bryobacterales bacterium]